MALKLPDIESNAAVGSDFHRSDRQLDVGMAEHRLIGKVPVQLPPEMSQDERYQRLPPYRRVAESRTRFPPNID